MACTQQNGNFGFCIKPYGAKGDGHEKMNYYFDGSAITDYSAIQARIVFFDTNQFYVLLLFDLASGISTRR
jgi:hypothetical protein